MGGARCSYRTCTTKSDKKTHMFHFPVFDKVRCHQWITNAQKLNFLDLKLSQLKNRVVCEHHFTDDAFMNVTKGKLKNSAVPTEDGPFCKPRVEEKGEREISINLDDIENDYLTNMEKKAHFSVKYGDFLTNDVTEPITLIPDYVDAQFKLQNKKIFNIFNRKYDLPKAQNIQTQDAKSNYVERNENDVKPNNTEQNTKTAVVDSLYQNVLLPNPKVVSIEYEELNLTDPSNKPCETPVKVPFKDNISESCVFPSHKAINPNPIPSNKHVKIISEKKITEPVRVIKSEFQPVSPSLIIKVPDKRKRQNVEMYSINDKPETNTLYFDVANPQQVDVQGCHNSNNFSSQHTVMDQICLNDFNQQHIPVYNNTEIQNINLQLQNNHNNTQFKQELEGLRNLQIQSVSTIPVEFVSTSCLNVPNDFTLSNNVEEVSMLPTNPTYDHNVSVAPSDAQNSTMILNETMSCMPQNATHVTDVSNVHNVSEMSINTHYISPDKKVLTLPGNNSASKLQLKNKMPPEKIAAIEQKRKFNMKLRDIIDSCLNKLDDEPNAKKVSAAMKRKLKDEKVSEHLSRDPDLPSKQESNIAYFEARLQRMEDTLLNKIEQNSQKITSIKRLINPPAGKKTVFTQTYLSAEATKRQLYQQISKFLSPSANSLVYEELFINQHVQKAIIDKSPKKRKRR